MKIYVDMDGVIADFEGYANELGKLPSEVKMMRGTYLRLKPYPDAKESINKLIARGFNLHVATKIPDDNPYAATEKLLWLGEHFPMLLPNVTITNDKGALGNRYSFLIDDRIHKANVSSFKGKVLHFGENGFYKNWSDVLNFFGVE